MIDESIVKQKPAERADIIIRVFNIKLKELLQDIVKGKRFGETLVGWYKELTVFYILANIIICTYGLIYFIYLCNCIHNRISKKRTTTCAHTDFFKRQKFKL
jgi:hypothetical protein